MVEEVSYQNRHSVDPAFIHPSHCPSCSKIWECDSQRKHKCIYCGHKLKIGLGLTQFAGYFVPIAAWLLTGVLILLALGKHYHG